jgi:hypothetical protein
VFAPLLRLGCARLARHAQGLACSFLAPSFLKLVAGVLSWPRLLYRTRRRQRFGSRFRGLLLQQLDENSSGQAHRQPTGTTLRPTAAAADGFFRAPLFGQARPPEPVGGFSAIALHFWLVQDGADPRQTRQAAPKSGSGINLTNIKHPNNQGFILQS